MLYAATIIKRTDKGKRYRITANATPWFLVHDSIFNKDHGSDPFIYVKSNLDKITKVVNQILSEAKTGDGRIPVWSSGQGIREVHFNDIEAVQIVPLEYTTANNSRAIIWTDNN